MKTYPTRVDEFQVGKWGAFKFTQWLHGNAIQFSSGEMDRLSHQIRPGSLVVDIGAYTGDTTIPFALVTGKTGKVVAFEPGPASFPMLQQNITQNDLSQVNAHQLAITKDPGVFTFHYVDPGYINGGFSTEIHAGTEGTGNKFPAKVTGVRLDKFLRERYPEWIPKWSHLKIDAEGYDKVILRSNQELIREFKPSIEIEVYPFLTFPEREDLKDAVRCLGYRWTCSDDQFHLPAPNVVNVLCLPN